MNHEWVLIISELARKTVHEMHSASYSKEKVMACFRGLEFIKKD